MSHPTWSVEPPEPAGPREPSSGQPAPAWPQPQRSGWQQAPPPPWQHPSQPGWQQPAHHQSWDQQRQQPWAATHPPQAPSPKWGAGKKTLAVALILLGLLVGFCLSGRQTESRADPGRGAHPLGLPSTIIERSCGDG
jgi:hypothetical protein